VLRHLDVGDQYTYAGGGESRNGGEGRAMGPSTNKAKVPELFFSFSRSRQSAEPFDP
jgi:hypothetical protein